MKSIIELNEIEYAYDEGETILSQLNFQIQKGEWVALVGNNGSGKSTVSRLIDGLLIPKKGTVKVLGMEMNEDTVWKIRQHIGIVFQNPDNQFVGANVEDDVAFGLENRGLPREEMKVRVKAALEEVGMWEYRKKEPSLLSGGQKQRVALAGVIAVAPDILILDEATSMLDPKGRQQMLALLEDLRKNQDLTILSITHDVNEMMLADRILVLDGGKIAQEGTAEELLLNEELVEKYHLARAFPLQLKMMFQEEGIPVQKNSLKLKDWGDALWTYMENK